MSELLQRPDWRLPTGVHAFVTTRLGGHSSDPWHAFNLAQHVGEDAETVTANRQLLLESLRAETGLEAPAIQWLRQVHGTRVFHVGTSPVPAPEADALYARNSTLVLGVLTADCLPVLFCSDDGQEIAVAHAGWRGLLGGVLEATLASFRAPPAALSTWLGPAIGPCHFEVGEEVRAAFLQRAERSDEAALAAAFAGTDRPGKWLADLYALAGIRLRARGVGSIHGEAHCTVCDHTRFYSYRKQAVTGRFATLILRGSADAR